MSVIKIGYDGKSIFCWSKQFKKIMIFKKMKNNIMWIQIINVLKYKNKGPNALPVKVHMWEDDGDR